MSLKHKVDALLGPLKDKINAGFEFFAGWLVLLHSWQIRVDGGYKGIAIPPILFFTLWGFWNLYYYPSLGQRLSYWCGWFIVSVNCLWLYHLWAFRGL